MLLHISDYSNDGGDNVYPIYVEDENNNVDPTPATRSFTINVQDTTPPDTRITDGPSGTIDYHDVTFTWIGNDDITPTNNLHYSYKLEGYDGSWSSWAKSTSKTYNDLPNGDYDGYVVNEIIDACYRSAKEKAWVPITLDVWRGKDKVEMIHEEKRVISDKYELVKEERMPNGDLKLILRDKSSGAIMEQIEKGK